MTELDDQALKLAGERLGILVDDPIGEELVRGSFMFAAIRFRLACQAFGRELLRSIGRRP